jgi:hypothetical protein
MEGADHENKTNIMVSKAIINMVLQQEGKRKTKVRIEHGPPAP